jgi:Fe-S-cluster containining protein
LQNAILLIIYHDPEPLPFLAKEKEKENEAFFEFLQEADSVVLDQQVSALQAAATSAIDCRKCGNCCRSLMINVEESEAEVVAGRLEISRQVFDDQYLEKGVSGTMILNQIPCPFLHHNSCTIYSDRFSGCREFPALHVPDFQKRLFTTFQHYDRCPIIFTVLESLKKNLSFQHAAD